MANYREYKVETLAEAVGALEGTLLNYRPWRSSLEVVYDFERPATLVAALLAWLFPLFNARGTGGGVH